MNNEPTNSFNSYIKNVIELINKMRDLGISAYFDLPTIVFCGKQSSGKSSLIEAMSGIDLPRATGTCTRTPTELRLTNSEEKWQCKIKIRYEENKLYSGIYEESFGDIIFNKTLVGKKITEAQNKILKNNEINSKSFQFSKNVICVDIKGPNIGDLALIDLPGLIEATEKNEDYKYISLVKNLVLDYIKHDNTIIAMAISCKDDMENQTIKTLANEVDPKGLRTIGILTKPDTIEQGCHTQYVDVLNGKRFPLRLGYYAVKNPTQQELNKGINRKEARINEMNFFRTTDPWKDAPNVKQFGCDKLNSKLGELLTNKINEQLPEMGTIICKELEKIKSDLSKITPKINEKSAPGNLLHMINSFKLDIQSCIDAQDEDKSFFRSVLKKYYKFYEILQEKRPLFSIRGNQEPDSMLEREPMIISKDSRDGKSFNEIKNLMSREQGRALITNMSYEPIKILIRKFVLNWKEPAINCLIEVRKLFEEIIVNLSKKWFGQYPSLNKTITGILIESLSKIEEQTKNNIEILFEMENDIPFTMNTSYLLRLKDKYAELLISNMSNNYKHFPEEDLYNQEAISTINNSKNSNKSVHTFLKKNCFLSESSKEAIKVIATVMAYFKISSKRFGDNIPMSIDKYLMRNYSKTIGEIIIEKVGLFDKNKEELEKMFEEDPTISNKRKILNSRKEQLSKSWNELRNFIPSSNKNYSKENNIINKKKEHLKK